MFKRICTFFSIIIVLFGVFLLNYKPMFADFTDRLELYLDENSSNAQIISVETIDYRFIKNIKGESFKIDKKCFSLDEFLNKTGGKVIFTETTEYGVSYYCYSNSIKYRKQIRGEIINLHVFVGKEQVTIGSPLIYGSF